MFYVRFYVLAEIGKSSSFPIFNIAVLYLPEPVGELKYKMGGKGRFFITWRQLSFIGIIFT